MANMKRMGDGYEIPPPLLRKINHFARELSLPELGLLIGSLHMCHLKLKGRSGAEGGREGVLCAEAEPSARDQTPPYTP